MIARDTLRQAASDADLEAYVDVLIAAFGLARSRAQTLHWASLFRRDDLWLAESARAEGTGLAALYASTFALYRKLGYELAGSVHVRQIRLRELGRDVGARTLTIRAAIEAYDAAWQGTTPSDNGQLVQ